MMKEKKHPYKRQNLQPKLSTLLLLILAFLSISTVKKETYSFLTALNYKGKIKSAKFNYYNATGDSSSIIKGIKVSSDLMYFSENRKLIKNINYDNNDAIIDSSTYKYNKRFQLVELCTYSASGNLNLKDITIYDKKGIKTERKQYNSFGRLFYFRKFIADDEGNIVESYNAIGNVYPKNVLKYDLKNNLIEEKIINSVGNFKYNYYTYDKSGNVIQELKLKSNGNIEAKFNAKYDKHGNQVSKILFDEDDKIVEKTNFFYNKKGEEIEQLHFRPDGRFLYSMITIYDKFGNPIKYQYSGYFKGLVEDRRIYDNSG